MRGPGRTREHTVAGRGRNACPTSLGYGLRGYQCEHIVDTVVYFEGDRYHSHRIVRCVKNRFGSTHEVGLFEMTGEGLKEVTDPGNLFMEHYGPQGQPSGSVITAAVQGSRVLLVEVQALTASSVIGAAKRKVSGVSSDRVAMIIAVLEKRAEMRLAADDVFVNVAGGVKVVEPATDLAVAMAIASAHQNRPLAPGTFAVGDAPTDIAVGNFKCLCQSYNAVHIFSAAPHVALL